MHDTKTADQGLSITTPNLLSLPTEIRLRIWEEILVQAMQPVNLRPSIPTPAQPSSSLSILLVSRLIYVEAVSIFCQHNQFLVTSSDFNVISTAWGTQNVYDRAAVPWFASLYRVRPIPQQYIHASATENLFHFLHSLSPLRLASIRHLTFRLSPLSTTGMCVDDAYRVLATQCTNLRSLRLQLDDYSIRRGCERMQSVSQLIGIRGLTDGLIEMKISGTLDTWEDIDEK